MQLEAAAGGGGAGEGAAPPAERPDWDGALSEEERRRAGSGLRLGQGPSLFREVEPFRSKLMGLDKQKRRRSPAPRPAPASSRLSGVPGRRNVCRRGRLTLRRRSPRVLIFPGDVPPAPVPAPSAAAEQLLPPPAERRERLVTPAPTVPHQGVAPGRQPRRRPARQPAAPPARAPARAPHG